MYRTPGYIPLWNSLQRVQCILSQVCA